MESGGNTLMRDGLQAGSTMRVEVPVAIATDR